MEKLRHASVATSLRNPMRNLASHVAAKPATPLKQAGDLLLVAFLTKTLSESGTRNLDPETLPLSEHLVIQILRRTRLDVSRKTDFFKWCSLRHNYKHSACTYSQMFGALCRAEYLEDVPSLLRLMKDDGVLVGPETFKMLLDVLIRLGKLDYAIQILDYMEELEANLSPLIYDSVIVALAKKNQVGLALNIFFKLLDDQAAAAGSSLPGSAACNSLLAALRKADKREDFRKVFHKLRETNGFEFDTWGYNICIHGFGMWGDLPTSLSLFREMQEKDDGRFGPDLCTYNSLIQSLCLAGKVKDALIVYEELKASGHRPDAFTYRILVQGCSKSSQINEATRIFSEMQYDGVIPEAVVYNSLLDGMFKANRVVEACQLFEKMVDDGVRATSWTYNILIHGLCRNGRAEAGYSLFCDLKKKGQLVDGVTYSIVVLQLVKEGELEEALRLVDEMEGKGIIVDLVTITALLVGFHRHGRWDWTERLMKHIRDGNLVPSVIKWQAEMEASLKNRKNRVKEDYSPLFPYKGGIKEFLSSSAESKGPQTSSKNRDDDDDQWSTSPHMDRLANQVKSGDFTSQLFSLARAQRVVAQAAEEEESAFDVAMVNTFMSIFLAKGKLSVACKLFEVFSNAGMNPASYTYNALMSSFVKKGYFDEAWNVLNEMGEKLCPADIATYNVIIQGLGKMGRADIASTVLDKLMDRGGSLDIVMYNTLINALGKAGRIDEANRLFEQMKFSGINPDVVTYNTLIEVHTRAGRLKEAHKLLKTMLDAGCLPDSVTDTILDVLAKEIDKVRYQKASIISQNNDNDSPPSTSSSS